MFDDLAACFYENVVSSFDDYRKIKASKQVRKIFLTGRASTKDDHTHSVCQKYFADLLSVAGRSRDIRTAMAAASAPFHLREHLPTTHTLSRAAVEKLCADYGVPGDIVKASKHASISGSTPHGAPLVTYATHLSEQIVLTEYKIKTVHIVSLKSELLPNSLTEPIGTCLRLSRM